MPYTGYPYLLSYWRGGRLCTGETGTALPLLRALWPALRPDSPRPGGPFPTELYWTPGWARYASTERRLEALLVGRLSGAGASSLRSEGPLVPTAFL